jgi:hypothetical protein
VGAFPGPSLPSCTPPHSTRGPSSPDCNVVPFKVDKRG